MKVLAKKISHGIYAQVPYVVFTLALSVLIGWREHCYGLVAWSSKAHGWPPMAPWSAIGFAAWGWANLGARTKAYEVYLGLIVAGFATLFLAENITNIRFSTLDTFFDLSWTEFQFPFPGRIAMGTCIGFQLTGLRSIHQDLRTRQSIGFLIAIIGAFTCMCFIFADPLGFYLSKWSNPMAVPSGVLFWLIGTYCMFESPVPAVVSKEARHG